MRLNWLAAAAVAICCAQAGPASADDRPVFPPTRDVAVTYKVVGGNANPGMPSEFHMTWSTAAQTMRMDIGAKGYMLMDIANKTSMMVVPEQKMIMTLPPGVGPAAMFAAANGPAPARKGSDTVAGVGCTIWENKSPDGHVGTACVTADGVMLRALGTSPAGQSGGLLATKVTYTGSPAGSFEVPKDYQTMEMPMPGMAPAPTR
jgi:hypothetical protein